MLLLDFQEKILLQAVLKPWFIMVLVDLQELVDTFTIQHQMELT